MSACGCGGAKCRLAAGDERHGTKNGYSTYGCRCDDCCAAHREYQAHYRARNQETTLAPGDPRHGTLSGYITYRCRCEPCREANRERNARYRAENAEKVREWEARYRAENAEKAREYGARYRAENAEKVRELTARWSATPEGRASNRAARRRRRERERLRYCGCDTRENLHAVWVMDEGLCAYCGAEGTDYEHVVPLAGGGWGCISNFRIACKSCNSKKGTKPLSVFLERLAASGVDIRPGATNSGLPCLAAAARMAARMLPAGSA